MNIFNRLFRKAEYPITQPVSYQPVCAQCAQFRACIYAADMSGNRKLADAARAEMSAHVEKHHGERR